jgi:hypothetical protein
MSTCSVCGDPTDLFFVGIPLCISCDKKRLEEKAALFPCRPAKPVAAPEHPGNGKDKSK